MFQNEGERERERENEISRGSVATTARQNKDRTTKNDFCAVLTEAGVLA